MESIWILTDGRMRRNEGGVHLPRVFGGGKCALRNDTQMPKWEA